MDCGISAVEPEPSCCQYDFKIRKTPQSSRQNLHNALVRAWVLSKASLLDDNLWGIYANRLSKASP